MAVFDMRWTETRDRVWTALVTVRRHLEGRPVLALVAPLTLVLLLLYPAGPEGSRVVLQIGAVAGLVYRPLQRVPGYWTLLALVMGIGCLLLWHDADNHKYLTAYWCLALGLCCGADDTAAALRINARLLVGLCFLFAVGWKLWTPDFVTGEFFEFAMLTDDRLFGLAQLFTGLSPEVYTQNQAAIDRLTAYSSTLEHVRLQGPARIHVLATFLTGWTLLIEAWVAISFLWPSDARSVVWGRNGGLLAFSLTTYFATPVSGFAWVLLILGMAQLRRKDASWRLMYLGGLAVMILYQLDFVDHLLRTIH